MILMQNLSRIHMVFTFFRLVENWRSYKVLNELFLWKNQFWEKRVWKLPSIIISLLKHLLNKFEHIPFEILGSVNNAKVVRQVRVWASLVRTHDGHACARAQSRSLTPILTFFIVISPTLDDDLWLDHWHRTAAGRATDGAASRHVR